MSDLVPGQAVLPALTEDFGYASITHLKPQQERFCWEFVLNNSNGKSAYLLAYPGSKDTSALANSCRLLKLEAIQKRITEIRAELQRRYATDAQTVIRLLTMTLQTDRRQFVDTDGTPLELHQLGPEAAAITDVEIVMDRNGKKHAIPVAPKRVSAAVELAKIMGITKDKIELSTPDHAVNFYIPENDRCHLERMAALRKKIEELKAQGIE
jgi:hypothetical protein